MNMSSLPHLNISFSTAPIMKDYRIKMLDRTTLKRKKTPQPQEDIFPFLKLPQGKHYSSLIET